MSAKHAGIAEEMQQLETLLRTSHEYLDLGRWQDAAALLQQAIALDPKAVRAYELMAQALEGLGLPVEAAKFHKLAKANRDEQWKRSVEAEIRSHHDVVGNVVKHEVP